MGKIIIDGSVSLNGFVAGAEDGFDFSLGRGGRALFEWMTAGPETNRVEPRPGPPEGSRVIIEDWAIGCGAMISGGRSTSRGRADDLQR